MLKIFYPDHYEKSTYGIDFEGLYASGVRGLIFDIDNTLVPHDFPADKRSRDLFLKLKKIGFKSLILSNNKEKRVKSFADSVGCPYIFKAAKPGISGYLKAMEIMGTDKKSTVSIGDQLFTDVLGANRAGIKNILVHPIDRREKMQIVLKRIIERPILRAYFRAKDRGEL
ncbi:MAG: YqeG family HAD IIIA-type phosphatase [Lachnospiraceae bacterium]|nr:YqeG family HAD IIIA-type phosphatase [Lachnospiraceae bacterium]